MSLSQNHHSTPGRPREIEAASGSGTSSINGRELLLGVSGGIAAYKSAMLASRLVQAGAKVSVVMTHAATQLVAPKTFEALTGRPVGIDLFGPGAHPHIEPANRAELLCVAPATANILAKAALGLADDLLSTLLLAFHGPVIMAPAMNCHMWDKPAVQRNVRQLCEDGVIFVDPAEGYLSCGEYGAGRMAEPEKIFDVIAQQLPKAEGARRSKAEGGRRKAEE